MNENIDNDCEARLRGAIIGFGNAAVYAHLPAWRKAENFGIEAIVEPAPDRAEIGKRLLPQAQIYPNMEALLSDKAIDFVDICTPPCFHVEQVVAACNSGLHVLCEKPLAIGAERLKEIQQLAEQTRRVVFTVNNWKYAPLWVKATELIKEDRIGAVQFISLNVLRPPNSGGGSSDWRRCIDIAQGGILIDHGWHNLYLILSLLDEFPISMAVKMECSPGGSIGLEETVDLRLRFRGAEASLHLTWQAFCRRNYGVIIGSKGSLFANDDHLILRSKDCPPVRFNFREALSAGSHHSEWMDSVVRNFGREIRDTRYRGANLNESLWCSQLINLAYRAGKDAAADIYVRNQLMETL